MNLGRPSSGFTRTLESLNGDGRHGLALLALVVVLLAPQLGGEIVQAQLRYERAAIAAGQWWRLATAHLVHLHLEHALLNVAGLVLMWALFARDYSPLRWLAVVGASVAAIDIGLWNAVPQVAWYVGASAALHGVMAAGTLAHLRRREPDAWILLACLVGKIAFELARGALPLGAGDAPVIVEAHAFGAAGGAGAALALGRHASRAATSRL